MGSRTTNGHVVRYALPFVIILQALYGFQCHVPESYAKRQGWTISKAPDNRSVYERSLIDEYIRNGNNDPKNRWRVLNYMMYFLAKEKAKTEINVGKGDKLTQYVEKLRNLNAVTDSAEVMSIYGRVFADDDPLWKDNSQQNYFISNDLTKRLDQVLRYGGFDVFGRLTEWGQTITRIGPFELEHIGQDGTSNSYVVRFDNGLHYRVVEDQKDFEFKITLVTDQPVQAETTSAVDDSYFSSRGNDQQAFRSNKLRMAHAHEYSTSIDSSDLTVRAIMVTALPSPQSPTWSGLDSSFFRMPWTAERLLIDLYANLKDFTIDDSLGKKLLHFSVEYTVQRLQPAGSPVDTLLPILTGKRDFTYDVTLAGPKDGFTARIVTDPLESGQSYRVGVMVSHKGRNGIANRTIDAENGVFPLAVADPRQTLDPRVIPVFNITPLSKTDTLHLFFALEGLIRNQGEDNFSAVAFVLCMDPRDRRGSVSTGDSLTVEWNDSMPKSEQPFGDYTKAMPKFGTACFDTLDISSDYPRGTFLYNVRLPNEVRRGTSRLLALDFYAIDKAARRVRHLGSASTIIQLD